jgi:alkylation response protein AidB-like acyl-CoA dehydrogenase
MSFALSEEHEELRRTVRAFLDDKSPEAEVRRLVDTETGYDERVWAQMAEQLGLQGIAIPEAFGGSGFGFVELGIVLEEMGRRLYSGPYLPSAVLAAQALLRSGDAAAQKEWLPGIAAGEIVATLAVDEGVGEWQPGAMVTEATMADGVWAVSGTKWFVLDGHVANVVLVAARTDGGVSLFAVPGRAEGVRWTPLTTLDLTRRQSRLELTSAPATLVGTEGAAWPVLEHVLLVAAVALASEQVGGAQCVLDMATEHAKERVQFGRAIGSYQAIKHKCANMLIEVESAKTAAYHAAWSAAEDENELPEAAAVAKSYCSDAYLDAASENIQIHGGMGYTWEHPAHLYYRRAKSTQMLFGEPYRWRARLARQLGIVGGVA